MGKLVMTVAAVQFYTENNNYGGLNQEYALSHEILDSFSARSPKSLFPVEKYRVTTFMTSLPTTVRKGGIPAPWIGSYFHTSLLWEFWSFDFFNFYQIYNRAPTVCHHISWTLKSYCGYRRFYPKAKVRPTFKKTCSTILAVIIWPKAEIGKELFVVSFQKVSQLLKFCFDVSNWL